MLVAMSTGIRAGIGDAIIVQVNGYDMRFEVISDNEVMAYSGSANGSCIDNNVSGSVSIPGYVTDNNGKSYLVTTIGEGAFRSCSRITDIIIPTTVKTIKWWAFLGCHGLTSVSFPASVTTLESQSFRACNNLQSISVSKNMQFMEGAFAYCHITSVTIDPDNPYLSMQDDVLYQTNEGKKTLIMHLNATTITSFDVPSDVNRIGNFTFYLSRITRCSLPESLETIGYYAFESSNLQEIDIPSSVTEIEYYAFQHCSDLKTVIINSKCKSTGGEQFGGIAEDAVLTVPLDWKSYYDETPWTRWFSAIQTYVPITETYFPDANFRRILRENHAFGRDGRLMNDEIAETDILDDYFGGAGIEDLTGIEYFTELTYFGFPNNQIKRVDFTKNTKLKTVCCETNQISGEDMDYFIAHLPTVTSNNGRLIVLDNTHGVTDGNEMTPEQVTAAKNKGWRNVIVYEQETRTQSPTEGFWQIRERWFPDAALRHGLNRFDFRCGNTVLTKEDAEDWEELELGYETEIQDLTGIELFTGLASLLFSGNKVKRADLSQNTKLTIIDCELNQISGADMDYFVNHLPQAVGSVKRISVYYGSNKNFVERNEMTPEQVAVAHSKGWTVTVYNDKDNEWEYETNGFWRITEERFPDPVFRELLDNNIRDGYEFRCKGALLVEDVDGVDEFGLESKGISDLTGIEYFTEMTSLLASDNNLTTIDLSNNKNLRRLECTQNKIKGAGMDALIASLPTLPAGEGFIGVYYNSNPNYPEGNIMTSTQVAAARAKGWIAYYWDDTSSDPWVEYAGSSTPTGIGEAVLQNDQDAPAYNLNGQRVNRDYRGIVIRKGRKTLNN